MCLIVLSRFVRSTARFTSVTFVLQHVQCLDRVFGQDGARPKLQNVCSTDDWGVMRDNCFSLSDESLVKKFIKLSTS